MFEADSQNLLWHLRRPEDLGLNNFGLPSVGAIGGPSEGGGPSQAPPPPLSDPPPFYYIPGERPTRYSKLSERLQALKASAGRSCTDDIHFSASLRTAPLDQPLPANRRPPTADR